MTLLEQTREAFANVRSSVVFAMQRLYEVHERKLYETVADSWGAYVESELGISQGFASKLMAVNKHYLLGGVSPEKLESIDYECLYLAAKTEGSLEEQVEKARLLTRRELKLERNDTEETPHEHIPCCAICRIRL